MAEFIRFTERLVSSEFRYAFALSAADLTGSRSLDLVATDADRGLYWFENDGAGNFTRHVVHLRTNELLERHAVADVNGDGKPEIVCVDNLNGCLLSFGFDGDPRDPHSWRHSYITEGGIPGAYDVAIADLDGDGDLDVAGSGWRISNQFAWFENRNGVWVKHIIDDDAPESRAVCAADVNGNGLIDIVGTASKRGEVAWYQNPGNSLDSPWTKHVIDTAPRPIHGHPVDMDGDGDIDLVMALGFDLPKGADPTGTQQIVWYENDGSSGIGPVAQARHIRALPRGLRGDSRGPRRRRPGRGGGHRLGRPRARCALQAQGRPQRILGHADPQGQLGPRQHGYRGRPGWRWTAGRGRLRRARQQRASLVEERRACYRVSPGAQAAAMAPIKAIFIDDGDVMNDVRIVTDTLTPKGVGLRRRTD